MIDFVTLSCPTCGGKLEITKEINKFACAHCGNEHAVVRKGGLISLHPVEQAVVRIEKNTDRTASELAIKRLTEEIRQLDFQLEDLLMSAWAGADGAKFLHLRVSGFASALFSSGEKRKKVIQDLSLDDLKNIVANESGSAGTSGYEVVHFCKKLIDVKTELSAKHKLLKKHKDFVDS